MRVLIVAFVFVALVGWILNFVKFCRCDFKAPYKAEILHGMGVVIPPLVVLGYLDVGK